MQIERIDHLNLTVADLERTIAFYERVLGMRSERLGEGRAALLFGQQKINLDLAGTGMTADKRQPAHICFVTETSPAATADHLAACGVPVRMQGERAGAIGPIRSLYFDDPDGHSIEIATY
jgi:catechol 2,3-dioxygenase-like lactoylglutathione lyase family enzyme